MMFTRRVSHLAWIILGAALAPVAPTAGADGPVLLDTGTPLATPVRAETLRERAGWKEVTTGAIHGDAILENARLLLIFSRADGRAILFRKAGEELREVARVAAGRGADSAASFSALDGDFVAPGMASVLAEAAFPGGTGSFHCRLTGDAPSLECRAVQGMDRFRLALDSAHAILPEIFGDDLVFRGGEAGKPALVLPAEHAVLHPLDGGDALLLASWPPAPKDVTVGGEKRFASTEIPCAPPDRVWLSVLAGKGIWHETDIAPFTIAEYRKLDWTPPFPARYRCDLRKDGGWKFTDSWMRQPIPSKFWSAFFSNGFPPVVMAGDVQVRIPRFRPGMAFPKHLPPEVKFAGPLLIYPFARETDARRGKTPDDAWTVLDVLRTTLGDRWDGALDIGEGILDVEPYPKGFIFVATCGATGKCEEIFTRGKEKDEAAAMASAFADMVQFVRYHRERIEEYVAYAGLAGKTIAESKAAHPGNAELESAAGDLAPLAQYIADLYRESLDAIKTPEHCKGLTEKALAYVGSQDPDRLKKVKELGVAMRTIGGRQDDLLAAFRMAVKALRQRAGQLHATAADPAVRELTRKLRLSTRPVLRVCSPYEEFLFLSAAWLAEKQ